MPQEITEKEYRQISIRLMKLLALYKNSEITSKQAIDKIFDYFFITK